MTNYTSGRRYEYKIIEYLKDYYCVRAAGSHTKFDIVAFRIVDGTEEPLVRAIQSKSGKKPIITSGEYGELKRLAKVLPKVISVELWLWTKGKTTPKIVRIEG